MAKLCIIKSATEINESKKKNLCLCVQSGKQREKLNDFSPSEQKFGMVLALQVFLDEVGQQMFEHIRGVLQPTL